jgi:penicillin-binding protein A
MIGVVEDGTGTGAAIDGVTVGGKTGTAQTGGNPTVWFVGFAEDEVAVAVVLPNSAEDATGGALAAPIARQVMTAALDR